MKIGLIDVDKQSRHQKTFPNLALCKIASYYRQQGDSVEWAHQMEYYDIIYMAKVFNFTPPDKNIYNAKTIIKGGTGYDIHSTLPDYIDDCQPDLSIYPDIEQGVSYGFLTRGCPNKCPWCVVPIKEGKIRPYWDIERVANGNKKVILMDNNPLALPEYAMEQLNKIIEMDLRVDFNQALDARLVTDDFAKLLARVKYINRTIRFGCDTPKQIEECARVIDMLASYGYRGEIFLYTMLNDDFEESFNRINYWMQRERNDRPDGIHFDCHAQPFRDPINPNKPKQWQLDLARWTNRRELCNSIEFKDYQPRKNFKCDKYFSDEK